MMCLPIELPVTKHFQGSGDPAMGGNEEKVGVSSSMDPVSTTVATSLVLSVVAGNAVSVLAMAGSEEHNNGRLGREKNGDGGGPPPSI